MTPDFVARVTIAAFIALAFLLPAIAQDPAYHRFADQRSWLGIPNAANVLSNLALVATGVYGAIALLSSRRAQLRNATAISVWCVAVGFILTGCGSAWYHLRPSDATLVWDRLPMTLVLTGVMSAAVAERIGENVARSALPMLIVFGVASVVYWRATGNVTPYGVFQFGGAAALIVLLATTRRGDDPFAWWWIAGWYCAARLAELADEKLWNATAGVVSGHTLKHFAAAAAGATIFYSLRNRYAGRRSTAA